MQSFHGRRAELDLNPMELAALAECDVDEVVRTECGHLSCDRGVRYRLSAAYSLRLEDFVGLADRAQARTRAVTDTERESPRT